jgi:CDK5 regulatory subunit-associated protein 3
LFLFFRAFLPLLLPVSRSLSVSMANEQNIPIDIHYDKLVEWLVTRNLCSLQWSKEVGPLRTRIGALVAELPMSVKNRLGGRGTASLTYFDCENVLEWLGEEQKNSGSAVKTFFGRYTNDQMTDWNAIIQDYRKGNVSVCVCVCVCVCVLCWFVVVEEHVLDCTVP